MDSEKATAVSPSSPLHARGPSVLDLHQKTIKSRRKEKRRRRTNSLSLRRGGSVRACVRTHS